MKDLLCITFLFLSLAFAQSKLELTPQGFTPLEFKTPNKKPDRLIEASKAWAPFYNKNGYDVLEVTENSLTIEAAVENAFHSYNMAVKYNYDIKYRLKIVFNENKTYSLNFSVVEIYADNVLLKTTTADFFNAEGKLKNDFRDAKPSLENTANKIIKSFTGFIEQ